ncbi:Hypothetical predicted protein [Olea europaea subsp. europaea]|uniref:Uncharacterized protein n=1 Tax=Olea europaea subsp. europaea TaxID=158383 RepID=A0A8S0VMC4_OLEEU|nr:Hypothetical predicted protein [Olea europaea subsp. europaea]
MDEYGIVRVSGLIDPKLLMKKLGKAGRHAELCWFQFGQCPSNLFLPNHENPHDYWMSGYDEYGRYFPFRQAFKEACLESSYEHVPPPTAPPLSFESSGCCTIM